jgi:hypothetical protein
MSPISYWCDSGASWSVTNPLPLSIATERWETPSTTSGTVSGAITTAFVFYHQYAVTFWYNVFGGGCCYTAPTVHYTAMGSPATILAALTGAPAWADAGTG